jgi:hypothetical protein
MKGQDCYLFCACNCCRVLPVCVAVRVIVVQVLSGSEVCWTYLEMHVVNVFGLRTVPDLVLVMISDLQGRKRRGRGGRERGGSGEREEGERGRKGTAREGEREERN